MSDGDDSTFRDPLRDPQHPNRPQHPDYWRIAEVLTWLDGQSAEGQRRVSEIIDDLVDGESLAYAAKQRALRAQQAVFAGAPDPRLTAVLGSVWSDAFTAGVRFQQVGGHRPD